MFESAEIIFSHPTSYSLGFGSISPRESMWGMKLTTFPISAEINTALSYTQCWPEYLCDQVQNVVQNWNTNTVRKKRKVEM
jgi:hypothetical protein